uniref:Uncharacterized protein n=1 Tax=Sphingomonas sp. JE1 TaxID=1628059 RepID=A0A0D4ZZC6_9SPHN|nr:MULTISPECIES: hypothetical protein [unclassified Sphingomonas]AJW29509.1 hypothetical protein pJE1_087 [Sphingomonas sp. JE1]
MEQNSNRLDHITWAAQPENQRAHVERLSTLCRTEFDGPIELADYGVRVFLSWESGLEVVSPTDESKAFAQAVRKHLDERGESLFAVVFGVPDLADAQAHARSLGHDADFVVDDLGRGPWSNKLLTMKEAVVGEIFGATFAFGEIRYRDGVLGRRAGNPWIAGDDDAGGVPLAD